MEDFPGRIRLRRHSIAEEIMEHHSSRYIPARTNEGWGIAGLIVGLAVLCIVGATVVHRATYKPPTDTSWRAAGGQPAAEGPAGH